MYIAKCRHVRVTTFGVENDTDLGFFDAVLTVHLNIILVINQLNAQIF